MVVTENIRLSSRLIALLQSIWKVAFYVHSIFIKVREREREREREEGERKKEGEKEGLRALPGSHPILGSVFMIGDLCHHPPIRMGNKSDTQTSSDYVSLFEGEVNRGEQNSLV